MNSLPREALLCERSELNALQTSNASLEIESERSAEMRKSEVEDQWILCRV